MEYNPENNTNFKVLKTWGSSLDGHNYWENKLVVTIKESTDIIHNWVGQIKCRRKYIQEITSRVLSEMSGKKINSYNALMIAARHKHKY